MQREPGPQRQHPRNMTIDKDGNAYRSMCVEGQGRFHSHDEPPLFIEYA
jgi:hypothetical protein